MYQHLYALYDYSIAHYYNQMKIILLSVSAVASQLQLHFQTRLQYPIAQRISTFITTHQQRSLHNVVLHQHRIVHLASRIAHYRNASALTTLHSVLHRAASSIIAYRSLHRSALRISSAASRSCSQQFLAAVSQQFRQQRRLLGTSLLGTSLIGTSLLARRFFARLSLHVAPGTSLLGTSLLARLSFARRSFAPRRSLARRRSFARRSLARRSFVRRSSHVSSSPSFITTIASNIFFNNASQLVPLQSTERLHIHSHQIFFEYGGALPRRSSCPLASYLQHGSNFILIESTGRRNVCSDERLHLHDRSKAHDRAFSPTLRYVNPPQRHP